MDVEPIEDSSRKAAPRELIHLLLCVQQEELKQLDRGELEPPEEALFDRTALRAALPEVSKVRLEQTLYAEYPRLKPWLQLLQNEKTEQTPTLALIWRMNEDDALKIANELVEVGFLNALGLRRRRAFGFPFCTATRWT
jgi:hypothetical protein